MGLTHACSLALSQSRTVDHLLTQTLYVHTTYTQAHVCECARKRTHERACEHTHRHNINTQEPTHTQTHKSKGINNPNRVYAQCYSYISLLQLYLSYYFRYSCNSEIYSSRKTFVGNDCPVVAHSCSQACSYNNLRRECGS